MSGTQQRAPRLWGPQSTPCHQLQSTSSDANTGHRLGEFREFLQRAVLLGDCMEAVELLSYCPTEMVGGGKSLNRVNRRHGRNVWLLRTSSWALAARLSCKEVRPAHNHFSCICVNEILQLFQALSTCTSTIELQKP